MNTTDYPSEEYYILHRLTRFLNNNTNRRFPIGIGDDGCIRNCGNKEQLVFTADTLVEDIHFSMTYMTPEEIGYKALVVNLSDCAAMGAIPDSALIQIVFPKKHTKKYIKNTLEMLYSGFNRACKKWDFPIVGGDLTAGPCWMIAISLTGRKSSSSRILRRVGAEVGDTLWATGIPGKSGAGLELLQKLKRDKIPDDYKDFVNKHIVPYAQIETGINLSDDENVHAVIDLSDGISKECYTLCYDNNIGILLNPKKNIILENFEKLGDLLKKNEYEWFLYGGEDYELLFTASKRFDPLKYTNCNFYAIGMITDEVNNVSMIDHKGQLSRVEKKAWDHLNAK